MGCFGLVGEVLFSPSFLCKANPRTLLLQKQTQLCHTAAEEAAPVSPVWRRLESLHLSKERDHTEFWAAGVLWSWCLVVHRLQVQRSPGAQSSLLWFWQRLVFPLLAPAQHEGRALQRGGRAAFCRALCVFSLGGAESSLGVFGKRQQRCSPSRVPVGSHGGAACCQPACRGCSGRSALAPGRARVCDVSDLLRLQSLPWWSWVPHPGHETLHLDTVGSVFTGPCWPRGRPQENAVPSKPGVPGPLPAVPQQL